MKLKGLYRVILSLYLSLRLAAQLTWWTLISHPALCGGHLLYKCISIGVSVLGYRYWCISIGVSVLVYKYWGIVFGVLVMVYCPSAIAWRVYLVSGTIYLLAGGGMKR